MRMIITLTKLPADDDDIDIENGDNEILMILKITW